MGKARKERVHEERGKGPSMKERVVMRMEETHDANTAKVRAQALEHWMEVCGVDSVDKIDYDNPIVHLEWFLCDFKMIAKLTGGQREEVLELMDESQRQVYLNCVDCRGNPYTDIEKKSIAKEVAKAMNPIKKHKS